jgi:hypothetical protein
MSGGMASLDLVKPQITKSHWSCSAAGVRRVRGIPAWRVDRLYPVAVTAMDIARNHCASSQFGDLFSSFWSGGARLFCKTLFSPKTTSSSGTPTLFALNLGLGIRQIQIVNNCIRFGED